MKRLIALLGKGLLGLLPLLLLLWLLHFAYDVFKGLFLSLFGWSESAILTAIFAILLIAIVLFIGYLIDKQRENWALGLLEFVIGKLPIIASIYGTLKDLVGMFSGKNTDYLGVAEVSVGNLTLIGFVTKEEGDFYYIFVPTTPNPTSGFLLKMKKSDVKMLDISVAQGFKKVVSLGLI